MVTCGTGDRLDKLVPLEWLTGQDDSPALRPAARNGHADFRWVPVFSGSGAQLG